MSPRSSAPLRAAPSSRPSVDPLPVDGTGLGTPGVSPTSADDERAAIRVDRARTELRHGRPIVLTTGPSDGLVEGGLLAAAIETLSPARLAALTAMDAPLQLLLTAQRLQALGIGSASSARALPIPTSTTLDALQLLAAVTLGTPDAPSQAEAEVADAPMQAAISIAKRARLTPALVVMRLSAAQLAALRDEPWLQLPADDVARVAPSRACALQRVSDAKVPITATEDCTLVLFREVEGDAEHVAILVGQLDRTAPVPVRLHSSCLTGDLLGSLRCDCGDQLRRAVDHLAASGGVLLYLAQEGRGTGLASKLRAYRLQDGGLDTLDADRHLGFREDERDFTIAAAMLAALDVQRIRLLTNNPAKIESLRGAGIDVVDRVPLIAKANAHNARYLRTKRDRAGHLRPDDEQL